jgi:hypothetical protein
MAALNRGAMRKTWQRLAWEGLTEIQQTMCLELSDRSTFNSP